MIFKDTTEAGMLLAAKLRKYKDDPATILAIPWGAVPVAYQIARELGSPMMWS